MTTKELVSLSIFFFLSAFSSPSLSLLLIEKAPGIALGNKYIPLSPVFTVQKRISLIAGEAETSLDFVGIETSVFRSVVSGKSCEDFYDLPRLTSVH